MRGLLVVLGLWLVAALLVFVMALLTPWIMVGIILITIGVIALRCWMLYKDDPVNKQWVDQQIAHRGLVPIVAFWTMLVVVGVIVTLVPWEPWQYRDFPYVAICFGWSVIIIAVAIWISRKRNKQINAWFNNWLKATDVVCIHKIGSQDNRPANTFMLYTALACIWALAWGIPTPRVDVELEILKAKDVITETINLNADPANETFLVLPFTVDTKGDARTAEQRYAADLQKYNLKPRFHRGWWHYGAVCLMLPVAFVFWAMSRRDEANELFVRWLDQLTEWRRKRAESREQSREERKEEKKAAGSAPSSLSSVIGADRGSFRIVDDLIAGGIIEAIKFFQKKLV